MTMAAADGRRWRARHGPARIAATPVASAGPLGEPYTMSASVAAAPQTPVLSTIRPQRGLISRLTAGFLFLATGLVLASAVLGLSVASAIIARGTVVADPGDVALIQALTPLFALFGVIAAAHLVAGIGIAFGSRQSAALGIGLGVFDAIAGVVGLFVAATGARNQADGVGIAMTFVIMGVVLAVAARAADWNTHAPVETD
jgi:hypothetical protein